MRIFLYYSSIVIIIQMSVFYSFFKISFGLKKMQFWYNKIYAFPIESNC